MNIAEYLTQIQSQGVVLYLDQGKLKFKAEKGCLTDEIKGQIRQQKNAIVEYLASVGGRHKSTKSKSAGVRPCRLSVAQERMWFIEQQVGASNLYTIPSAIHIDGELDIELLKLALNAIVKRHRVLRSNYIEKGGKVFLVPRESFKLDLPVEDLRGEQAEQFYQILAQEVAKSFDLAKELMLKVKLYIVGDNQYVLVYNMHHIASDGWSLNIFLQDLKALYTQAVDGKLPTLDKLPIQFSDYCKWERRCYSEGSFDDSLVYWKQKLAGIPNVHSLPLDKPRPPKQTFEGTLHTTKLSLAQSKQAKALCDKYHVTPFIFYQSLFALFLSRISNENDIMIGTPVAGRTLKEFEPLIGYFVSTLVLRNQLEMKQRFSDYLQANRDNILEAFEHQNVPFENFKTERNPSYSPIFQIFFSFGHSEDAASQWQDLYVRPVNVQRKSSAKFELTMSVTMDNDTAVVQWVYNNDLWQSETIARWAASYEVMLNDILSDPTKLLGQINLLTQQQQNLLLNQFSGETLAPQDKLLHQYFEQQAKQQPQHQAVYFEGQSFTYQQLDQRANQLAHYLIVKGLQTGQAVALHINRGLLGPVAFWGIIKAGGVYLPIDAKQPLSRCQSIIATAGVSMLLTDNDIFSAEQSLKSQVTILDLNLDEVSAGIDLQSKDSPEVALDFTSPIYSIFTSGSTGKPKGVLVCQQQISNRFESWRRDYQLDELNHHLQGAGYAFDVSIGDYVRTFCSGGTLTICPGDVLLDAQALSELINLRQIEFVDFVPVVLQQLAIYCHNAGVKLPSFKVLAVGGDLWHFKDSQMVVNMLSEDCRFYNTYGLTETVVDSTIHLVDIDQDDANQSVIGKPYSGVRLYVADRHDKANRQLVPIGVAGELMVGGDLSEGYIGLEQETAERFVSSRCIKQLAQQQDSRLFASGDLVRWLESGGLEYLGRIDQQVQIRGLRVELGEIETGLLGDERIDKAIVVVNNRNSSNPVLVAYLVLKQQLETPPNDDNIFEDIKQVLADKIPSYMVPAVYIGVDDFKHTPNGKVNRKYYVSQNIDSYLVDATGYEKPANDIEQALADIFAEVLDIEGQSVSAKANFFELGGHSLLVVRLIADVREKLGWELSINQTFEHPTIRQLAELIATDVEQKSQPTLEVYERHGVRFDLSFAQQRMWFIDQMASSPAYNIPMVTPIEDDFDVAIAEQVFKRIIERHEALRTVIVEDDIGPLQVIREQVDFTLERVDLRNIDNEQLKQQQLVERIKAQELSCFDLAADLMVRGEYVYLSDDPNSVRGMLLYTFHHIASDGWSMDNFIAEFDVLYQAFSQAQPDSLEPLEVQYLDYTLWQRQYLQGEVLEQQLSFWQQTLADVPVVHSLPLDRPRPEKASDHGAAVNQSLSVDFCQQIQACARAHGITPFMLIHGALALLIARHSYSDDIVIGSPVANRMHKQLQPLIGFFVNTLTLRLNTNQHTVKDFYAHVLKVNNDAQSHQDVPFEQLVEHLNLPRSTAHLPLFQIMFTVVNQVAEPNEYANVHYNSEQDEQGLSFAADVVAKAELFLDARMSDSGGDFCWTYNTDIFDQQRIVALNRHLINLLECIFAADEHTQLSQLQMLSEAEVAQQIDHCNDNRVDYPAQQNLKTMFEQQVAATPDAMALICREHQLTYQQLNLRANGVAKQLIDAGIGLESSVGIYVERDVAMLVAILAVLKVGGSYVPLDPNYPTSRIAYLIEDAKVTVVLCQSSAEVFEHHQTTVQTIVIDSNSHSENNPEVAIASANTALMIYTSGSTGQPKGVQISHQSVLNVIHWGYSRLDEGDYQGVLASTSMCFDISIYEFFLPLLSGNYMVLVENILDLAKYSDNSQDGYPITLINTVPSAAMALVELADVEDCVWPDSVKVVNLAGESLTQDLVQTVERQTTVNRTPAKVFDLYGPSECTIYTTYAQRYGNEGQNIGKGVSNSQLYVLDQDGQIAPYGSLGQLYIAGDGVSRGYLHRSAMSAEKFIPDPFSKQPGARMYSSGDLVRYDKDGRLLFMGRADHQVKVNGFRIELPEIENQLASHPHVSNCAVVVKSDSKRQKRIVAYVMCHSQKQEQAQQQAQEQTVSDELKHYLADRVPSYMVPAAFVLLAQFELTPSGKIDRKRLPDPTDGDFQSKQYLPPRNEIETQLCDIWQSLFNLDKVGINDNFFDLGGHSLLTVKLLTRVKQQFGAEVAGKLSLFDVFAQQTIAEFAPLLQRGGAENDILVTINQGVSDIAPVFVVPGMGGSSHVFYPLSRYISKQHSLYGLDALGIGGEQPPHQRVEDIAHYNVRRIKQLNLSQAPILIGHSLGGCVAFEMAKLLQAETGMVAQVVLLDAPVAVKGQHNIKQLPAFINQQFAGMEQQFADLALKQLAIEYQPNQQPFEHLVVATVDGDTNIEGEAESGVESRSGHDWQLYSKQTITTIAASGDHFSMLLGDNVKALAQSLAGIESLGLVVMKKHL